MWITIIALTFAYLLVVYHNVDENDLSVEKGFMSDKEFEYKFIGLIAKVERGNINWTLKALKQMHEGYDHYSDNDRAMSILRTIEKGIRDNDPNTILYIRNCAKYIR